MTAMWLVIIALLVLALTRIGIAVRDAPWLNDDNPRPMYPTDLESRRFSD